ncbi:hypothetical protein SH668x_003727 [Planctomicrobium sp. SH668]|uniref:hypothetical protein n=1 Tax=Planctomicrobium sp. SH668 TaxID=3448126 RepID=UPI003F5C5140
MPLKQPELQNQLERAKAALSRVEAGLGEQTPKKNPDWRKANSRVQQIEERLNSRNVRAGAGSADAEAAE